MQMSGQVHIIPYHKEKDKTNTFLTIHQEYCQGTEYGKTRKGVCI